MPLSERRKLSIYLAPPINAGFVTKIGLGELCPIGVRGTIGGEKCNEGLVFFRTISTQSYRAPGKHTVLSFSRVSELTTHKPTLRPILGVECTNVAAPN